MSLPKIFIALDKITETDLFALVNQFDPKLCGLKIGSILFTEHGPRLVQVLQQRGFTIFLDLKFHDIPQTVAGAVRAASKLQVALLTVHAAGGEQMLKAAVSAAQECVKPPKLFAVTVLTSLSAEPAQVVELAAVALRSGCDGVVCSGHELTTLRENFGDKLLYLTPGIRLQNDAKADQQRIMLPEEALKLGSDFLVIGRSITNAKNPSAVLQDVLSHLT